MHPDERVRPIVRSGLVLCEDGEMRRGHVYRCSCGAVRALIGEVFGAWVEPEAVSVTIEYSPGARVLEICGAPSHAELRDAG